MVGPKKSKKPAAPTKKPAKKPAKKAAAPTNKPAKPAAKPAASSSLPKAFVQALAKAAKVDGRFCYGLPHYEVSAKLKFSLVEPGDMELFEENDVDTDETPGWIPFASLGEESQFLAIHTDAPYRVGMWEHETGQIHDVWPSLEEFTSRALASKKDKTPYELLDKVLDKTSELVDADAYAKALELLEPAIAKLPSVSTTKRDEQLARLNNLWGLALQGVGRLDEAFAAFERAAAAGEDYAQLNIMDMLLEKRNDPAGVLVRARAMRDGYLTAYERTWTAIYIALASLALGDAATAETELRDIVGRYAIKDAAMVTAAREKLEEYANEGKPNAAVAKGFLAWLAPKSYDAIAPAEATANRAWWAALHPKVREALLEAVKLEVDGEPTDAQIAQCLDAESCHTEDEAKIDDVTPYLRLRNLQRLSFYGDPESIEPLRALPKLEYLTIDNMVIKDFAWPSRAQRDLWVAAEKADQRGMEKALAAGADVNAHSHDWGKTAFHLIPFGDEHRPLALWLVEHGADPYAGNHGDGESYQVEWWPEDMKARAFAAMKKFGHAPIADSPWREVSAQRVHRVASFEKPGVHVEDKDLDDGDSLVAEWPSDVTLQMAPPKKDDKIADVMNVKYDEIVVSEKVAEVLRADRNIELLPVRLVKHDKKPVPGTWYFVNPLAKDCLIPEKCHFQWNHIDPDSASALCSYAIDPARVGDAQMFRPTILNTRPMIVTKALADKLAAFGDCVRITTLKR